MKPTALSKYLIKAILHNWPTLVTGAPGGGKTDIISDAAIKSGADLLIFHPVVSDPTDFKGLPFSTGDGRAEFLPYGDLDKLAKAERLTVCFLDDLGQASIAVQAACMQLVLARQINGHRISDKVVFLAATNRAQDMAGVTKFLAPLRGRFYAILPFDVDAADWVSWAVQHNMPPELIAFVRVKPSILDPEKPSKDIVNQVSPRTLAHVGEQQRVGLDPDEEAEVYAGAAGDAFAAQYMAFLKMARDLPSTDDILADPGRAYVPTDPSMLYVVTSGLARRMTDQNIGKVISYLDRVTPDFAVSCMIDAKLRNKEIARTTEFILWGTKNYQAII